MISVVIPTFNAENTLPAALSALVPAVVEGLVREVVIVDGGSTDHTLRIADGAGVEIIKSQGSRGARLRLGAGRAKFPWLLFLHPDAEIESGFEREVAQHIERVESGRIEDTAAAFRLAIDDRGAGPRVQEFLASSRCALLGIPYGNQGLLLQRQLYESVGGYTDVPVMADVDLVRRLGRRRITMLRSRVVVGAAGYRHDGYTRRAIKNSVGLALYACGVPLPRIAKLYGEQSPGS